MAKEKPANVVQVEEAAPETAPPEPETVKDVEEEKTAIEPAPEQKRDDDDDDSKALSIVDNSDLASIVAEKRLSLINAWEENEKAKAEERAFKKIASIVAWEIAKKAEVEAELKNKQEELEKKKVEHAEAAKRRLASLQKIAEEEKAIVEARRGKEIRKAEVKSANYRATQLAPVISKRFFALFGA